MISAAAICVVVEGLDFPKAKSFPQWQLLLVGSWVEAVE